MMLINMIKCRDWFLTHLFAVINIMFVTICFGPVLLLVWLWSQPGKLYVYSTTPSPDGKRAAVIYEMGGGATAPFNTQISIAPADKPFSPDKNPSFLSLRGQHDLTVRWIGERAMEVIGIPQDFTSYRMDTSVGDVTIEYRDLYVKKLIPGPAE